MNSKMVVLNNIRNSYVIGDYLLLVQLILYILYLMIIQVNVLKVLIVLKEIFFLYLKNNMFIYINIDY